MAGGFWSGLFGGAASGASDFYDDYGVSADDYNIGPVIDNDTYGSYLDTGDTSGFQTYGEYFDEFPIEEEDQGPDWWDRNKGDVFSAAFSTASKAGMAYLSNEQKKEATKESREYAEKLRAEQLKEARENKAFELRLAALKQLYGGGSGGGGGGSSAAANAAILNTFNQQSQLKQRSISDAAASLSQAYGLGGQSR